MKKIITLIVMANYNAKEPDTKEVFKDFDKRAFKVGGKTLEDAIDNARDCVEMIACDIEADIGFDISYRFGYLES